MQKILLDWLEIWLSRKNCDQYSIGKCQYRTAREKLTPRVDLLYIILSSEMKSESFLILALLAAQWSCVSGTSVEYSITLNIRPLLNDQIVDNIRFMSTLCYYYTQSNGYFNEIHFISFDVR